MHDLTPKQRRFVDEYLVDLNATEAARRAGYSAKTARQSGSENLTRAKIQRAIAEAMQQRAKRVELDQDRVLRELAAVGMSNIDHYTVEPATGRVVLREGASEDAVRAVSSVKVKSRTDDDGNTEVETELKLWSKPVALKLLGQHLGMFVQRHELSGGLPAVEVVMQQAGPQSDRDADEEGDDDE